MIARLVGVLSAALVCQFGIGIAIADEPAAPAANVLVPAGTLVMLRMQDGISSDTSRAGDRFRFVVDEPVIVDARVVIPRGAIGFGEVLHTEEAGGTKPGELIAVARSLTVAGREVPLRTFVGGSADRDVDALAVSFLSRTANAPFPAASGFMHYQAGMKMVLGAGGVASARTARALELPGIPAPEGAAESGHDLLPDIDHGTVVFFRQKKPEIHVTTYRIFADDDEAALGGLRVGNWFPVSATPGRHIYRLRPSGDPDVVLEVTPGETYYVVAGIGQQGFAELAVSNKHSFESLRASDPLVERRMVPRETRR